MIDNNQLRLCSEYVLLLAKNNQEKISLKKLHIILYYSYVEYLITNRQAMFEEKFHTWSNLSIPELYDEAYPTWMGDILLELIEFHDELLEDETKKELLTKYYTKIIKLKETDVLRHLSNVDAVYKAHSMNDLKILMRSNANVMPVEEIYDFYKNPYNFKKLISNLNHNPRR